MNMEYFVISENIPNCEEGMWHIDVELHVADVIELKDDSDNDINLKIVERRFYPWANEWNFIAELLVQPQQILHIAPVMPSVCEHEWHHIGNLQGWKVMQCVKCDKGDIAH